jgi:hypothetical protein
VIRLGRCACLNSESSVRYRCAPRYPAPMTVLIVQARQAQREQWLFSSSWLPFVATSRTVIIVEAAECSRTLHGCVLEPTLVCRFVPWLSHGATLVIRRVQTLFERLAAEGSVLQFVSSELLRFADQPEAELLKRRAVTIACAQNSRSFVLTNRPRFTSASLRDFLRDWWSWAPISFRKPASTSSHGTHA